MNDPLDTPPVRRSTRRDSDVRAVSRVTWGIAAAAIAGTVTVGALAAGGVSSQSGGAVPAASDGAVPIAQDAYVAPDPAYYGDGDRGEDGEYRDNGGTQPSWNLQPPQSAPTQSFQPPAASSGGS